MSKVLESIAAILILIILDVTINGLYSSGHTMWSKFIMNIMMLATANRFLVFLGIRKVD